MAQRLPAGHIRPATRTRLPLGENAVMPVTVVVTAATHDPAHGAGVLTAMVLLARRVAHLVEVIREPGEDTTTQVRDASTVATLDAITTRYEARGTAVAITGTNPGSAAAAPAAAALPDGTGSASARRPGR